MTSWCIKTQFHNKQHYLIVSISVMKVSATTSMGWKIKSEICFSSSDNRSIVFCRHLWFSWVNLYYIPMFGLCAKKNWANMEPYLHTVVYFVPSDGCLLALDLLFAWKPNMCIRKRSLSCGMIWSVWHCRVSDCGGESARPMHPNNKRCVLFMVLIIQKITRKFLSIDHTSDGCFLTKHSIRSLYLY